MPEYRPNGRPINIYIERSFGPYFPVKKFYGIFSVSVEFGARNYFYCGDGFQKGIRGDHSISLSEVESLNAWRLEYLI